MAGEAGKEAIDENVDPGEFPFPITHGAVESPYLVWLRNHSNYMAVRGLSDYLRAISVLARGILVNFLIFLPYLLAISIVVAVSTYLQQPPPFLFTKIFLILFAAWILIFPVATPFFRILRFKRTQTTGSDSSVQQRDKYERGFGTFLLAILAIAAIESLPGLLDVFRSQIGWPTLATTVAITTAVFTIAPNVYSALGEGLTKKLILFAVGALGLIVPLVVVLAASGFLVFDPPTDWTWVTVLVGAFIPLLTIFAVIIGVIVGAFRRHDFAGVALLVTASVGLVVLVFFTDQFVARSHIKQTPSLRDAAFVVLQEDEQAMEGLIAHIAQHPSRNLRQLTQLMDESREPRPKTAPLLRFKELAETGEGAGLYPEFAQIVLMIMSLSDQCDLEESPGEGCAGLRSEIQRLQFSAGVLRDAFETQTPGELSTHLLSLSEGAIDTLIHARDGYPHLLAAFDLAWDSVSTPVGTDFKCRSKNETLNQANKPAAEQEEPAFCVVQTTLSEAGIWFQTVRRELAGVASLSLRDAAFYTTVEAQNVRKNAFWPKIFFACILAIQLWFFCWLTVDVNLTSIHGLYRDRLASAFLVGKDTEGNIDIEKDLDLMEICQYEAGSTAPYHLINAALNLQGSKDIGIRDRRSDFFVFSKKFIGGQRTGYCRSEHMELVYPQMDLATAMAISAAAASPNMGRATSPALVAIMTLLNIRLGFWIPNPGLLEQWLASRRQNIDVDTDQPYSISFSEVFAEELVEIQKRWKQLPSHAKRHLAKNDDGSPLMRESLAHGLAGIGYSGGGIRSATLNLGITQALHEAGVFDHMDYMSTVSGGGYLGIEHQHAHASKNRGCGGSIGKTGLSGC